MLANLMNSVTLVCTVFLMSVFVEGFLSSGSSVTGKERPSFSSTSHSGDMKDLESSAYFSNPSEQSNAFISKISRHIAQEALTSSVPSKGLLLTPVLEDRSLTSLKNFSFYHYFDETAQLFTYSEPTKLERFTTSFNLWKQFPWQKIRKDVILKATIGGTLPLTSPPRSFFSIPEGEKEYEQLGSLEEITNFFLFAASDPRVKGVLLEINPISCGYGKLFELTRLIHYFKQSKKPIVAYSESNTEKEFYLACQCDKRFMPPEGNLDLRGLVASASFYGTLFEKIGIEPQVQRFGKYKSFGDTFNRQNMSDAQREVTTSLLLQSSSFWLHSLSEILKVNISSILELWNNPHQEGASKVRNVYDYEKLGLLSGVLYFDQVEKYIETMVLKESITANYRPRNFLLRWVNRVYQTLFPRYPFTAQKVLYYAHNNTKVTIPHIVNETAATEFVKYAFVESRGMWNQHEHSFNLTEEYLKYPRRVVVSARNLSENSSSMSSMSNDTLKRAMEDSDHHFSSGSKHSVEKLESLTEQESMHSIDIPTSQSVNNDGIEINGTHASANDQLPIHPDVNNSLQISDIPPDNETILLPKWFNQKLTKVALRNYLDSAVGQRRLSSLSGSVVKFLAPRLWKEVSFYPAQRYLRKMRRGYRVLKGLPLKETSSGKRIGIINAAGSINPGSSFGSGRIGSDTMIELLRMAREDEEIEGVVLRIDSPGGSALASDLVWREIRALARVKPVVASMIDVAASGGYYFAMACDQIVAEDLTVTGSIGVVAAKFNTEKLNEKLGIGTETISIGRFAEVFSVSKRFTEDEAAYFEEAAKSSYQTFVEKAAASRSMNFTSLNEIAQGRVWTGRQAYDRGLVDHLGGLWKAIEIVQHLVKNQTIGGADSEEEKEEDSENETADRDSKKKRSPQKPIKIEYIDQETRFLSSLRRRGFLSLLQALLPWKRAISRSASSHRIQENIYALAPEEIYYTGYADGTEHYGELADYSLRLGINPFLFSQILPSSLKTFLVQLGKMLNTKSFISSFWENLSSLLRK